MNEWVRQAVKYSDGALWNNGIWVLRNMKSKGKQHIVSNHSRGLAVDLSYRGRPNGRKKSLAYIIKLLENADTLGIQLVIDYHLGRSWKCDRGTWIAGNYDKSDWWHIEVHPRLGKDPILAKAAWLKVFGACHTAAPTVV